MWLVTRCWQDYNEARVKDYNEARVKRGSAGESRERVEQEATLEMTNLGQFRC